jgi:hypothetical protein
MDTYNTQNIIKIIDETTKIGINSLEMLNNQYETLQKINKLSDNINENLTTSSSILGKIKYFFFPEDITKIEKIQTDDINNNKDSLDENKIDEINNNLDEINIDCGLSEITHSIKNLKNIALEMNYALEKDKELLDKINNKSEIINSNMKKINKEITKLI